MARTTILSVVILLVSVPAAWGLGSANAPAPASEPAFSDGFERGVAPTLDATVWTTQGWSHDVSGACGTVDGDYALMKRAAGGPERLETAVYRGNVPYVVNDPRLTLSWRACGGDAARLRVELIRAGAAPEVLYDGASATVDGAPPRWTAVNVPTVVAPGEPMRLVFTATGGLVMDAVGFGGHLYDSFEPPLDATVWDNNDWVYEVTDACGAAGGDRALVKRDSGWRNPDRRLDTRWVTPPEAVPDVVDLTLAWRVCSDDLGNLAIRVEYANGTTERVYSGSSNGRSSVPAWTEVAAPVEVRPGVPLRFSLLSNSGLVVDEVAFGELLRDDFERPAATRLDRDVWTPGGWAYEISDACGAVEGSQALVKLDTKPDAGAERLKTRWFETPWYGTGERNLELHWRACDDTARLQVDLVRPDGSTERVYQGQSHARKGHPAPWVVVDAPFSIELRETVRLVVTGDGSLAVDRLFAGIFYDGFEPPLDPPRWENHDWDYELTDECGAVEGARALYKKDSGWRNPYRRLDTQWFTLPPTATHAVLKLKWRVCNDDYGNLRIDAVSSDGTQRVYSGVSNGRQTLPNWTDVEVWAPIVPGEPVRFALYSNSGLVMDDVAVAQVCPQCAGGAWTPER